MTGDMKYQKIMKYLVVLRETRRKYWYIQQTVYRLYRHLVLQGF